MKNKIVSVIIPVYNVEGLLNRCINSVIKQTYKNLEIILVNDGSTDQSLNICLKYEKNDCRIRVLNQQNGGQASARNYGVIESNGDFITFVDSDDYINVNYIESMMKLFEADEEIDIATCEYQKVYDNGNNNSDVGGGNVKVYYSEDALELLLYQKKFNHSPWCKIFRKQVFDKIRFPCNRGYEDLAIIYKTFSISRKIAYIDYYYYYYYQRNNSTMRNKFDSRKIDRIVNSEEMMEYIKGNHPNLINASINRYFLSNLQLLKDIPKEAMYNEIFIRVKKNIKKYRKKIIQDKNTKFDLKCMALCSYLGIKQLRNLGQLYDRIFNKV